MRRLLLLAALLPLIALADPEYGSAQVQEITSIYDADTFRATIAGWPPVAGERVPVRIVGIDAPELRGRCDREKRLAREAKQYVVGRLRAGRVIELTHLQRDKYFRLLAHVVVDGEDLGDALLRAGYARPYDGGRKAGWCD